MKKEIEEAIKTKSAQFQSSGLIEKQWIDVTAPGQKPVVGHLHPLTQVIRKAEEIFQSMGFVVIDGPEVENEWYNFDALNVPQDHPAREMQDTLFIKQKNREVLPGREKLLMRTQTSAVQVRFMEMTQPPLRIIAPGRVFRHEATDASHEINFYHLECLMVDKEISVANFKAIIKEFLSQFFKKPVNLRMRPSYFPFVAPGFEIDVNCLNCQGKGCPVCQKTGWVEMLGAGMVHPNVFKNAGLNPKDWQGFAFAIGLDRLAMLKYKINDIRLFYSGDLRFLKQF